MDKQRTKKKPALAGRVAALGARLLSQERLRGLGRGALRFVLCTVLARAGVFGGYAPFGLAMACALMVRGSALCAVLGVFCGAFLLRGNVFGMIYAAAALLALSILTVCAGLRVVKKWWFAPMVAIVSGAACTFVLLPIGQALSAQDVLAYVAAQGLSGAGCVVYGIALAPPQGDWRRPVTMLFLAASVLLALSDLTVWHTLSPARAAALLCALGTAYVGGCSAGAAAGVAFGAAMDLGVGQGALFACGYGLCALTAGLFRERGRLPFAVSALAAGLCAALLGAAQPRFVPFVLELILAVAVFTALPRPFWKTLRQQLAPGAPDGGAGDALRRQAAVCAGEAAQGFYELYRAMMSGVQRLRPAGDQNVRAVFDRAGESVCKKCVLCSQCWQRDYLTTLSALNDVTGPMLRRGKCELSDFPRHFASRCVHLPELMQSINHALFALREREQMRREQAQNESLLARQYAGLSDILKQIAAAVTQDTAAQPQLERQVRRYAAAFGWIDRVSALRDGNGRLVIELGGAGLDEVLQQGEGFASGLSALLGVALTEPHKVEDALGTRLLLRERAPFRVIVGVARQQKQDTAVSGDSGCYFITDQGRACLLLADGMGSGARAQQDSRGLVTAMERFLRAGVTPSEAYRAIAPVYRLRCEGTRPVTLDVLWMDLFSGRAERLCCGAAPAYLKLGAVWQRLPCTSLPIGLGAPTEEGPAPMPFRFGHGDRYVMVSDGVSDGQEDEWLRDMLRTHEKDSPKELAIRLVTAAKCRNPDDDRTALVLHIEHLEHRKM